MSPTSSTIKKKGITLIETILYMFILTLLMGIIVELFIGMGKAYKSVKAARETEVSATIALEGMLREIRNSSSVDTVQSTLDSSPGTLVISGTDEGLNSYTITFSLSGGAVFASKNGGAAQSLTGSVPVSYLKFVQVSTSSVQAVRVELEAGSEKFYGFAVLRGSY